MKQRIAKKADLNVVGKLRTDFGSNSEKIKLLEKWTEGKSKLENLRNDIGESGGAGHFWGNDKAHLVGGVRATFKEPDLKNVMRLLAAGQKKINLKEKGVLRFFE